MLSGRQVLTPVFVTLELKGLKALAALDAIPFLSGIKADLSASSLLFRLTCFSFFIDFTGELC